VSRAGCTRFQADVVHLSLSRGDISNSAGQQVGRRVLLYDPFLDITVHSRDDT